MQKKPAQIMWRRFTHISVQAAFFSTLTSSPPPTSTSSCSTFSLPNYLEKVSNLPEHQTSSSNNHESQSQPVKILNSSECEQLFPMSLAIRCQAEAFASTYNSSTTSPSRLILNVGDNDDTLFKPSFSDTDAMGVKIISVRPNNPIISNNTIPSLTGCILLFNKITGEPLCLMDASFITARRTAAGSGLATDMFAKEDCKHIVIFGAGKQANEHIRAILTVRPNIEIVYIINRNKNNAEILCNKYKNITNGRIQFIAIGLDEFKLDGMLQSRILENADVVATTTNSKDALFDGKKLVLYGKGGVHINCVGSYKPSMKEIDDIVVSNSILFIDSEHAFDCGDLCGKEGKKKKKENNFDEIGKIVFDKMNNKVVGKPIEDKYGREVTLFESVGVSAQDLHSAYAIYKRACDEGVGTNVML